MQALLELVNSIEHRLRAVSNQTHQLKQTNATLREELLQAQVELTQKNDTIREWKMKYEALQTANSLAGSDRNTSKAKKQIDRLIEEIDACLAQVSLD
jgi:predicted  nucleic acid-binding Zn-ribbon protein